MSRKWTWNSSFYFLFRYLFFSFLLLYQTGQNGSHEYCLSRRCNIFWPKGREIQQIWCQNDNFFRHSWLRVWWELLHIPYSSARQRKSYWRYLASGRNLRSWGMLINRYNLNSQATATLARRLLTCPNEDHATQWHPYPSRPKYSSTSLRVISAFTSSCLIPAYAINQISLIHSF